MVTFKFLPLLSGEKLTEPLNKDEEKLYFIVETKGSLFEEDRRETENLKIKCGKEHFKAVNTGIGFKVASSFENFFDKI